MEARRRFFLFATATLLAFAKVQEVDGVARPIKIGKLAHARPMASEPLRNGQLWETHAMHNLMHEHRSPRAHVPRVKPAF